MREIMVDKPRNESAILKKHMPTEATQQRTILELVVGRAIEVIGNKDEALRWLNSPVRALNYATPLSLLDTPQGTKDVLTVLGRLEHGVL